MKKKQTKKVTKSCNCEKPVIVTILIALASFAAYLVLTTPTFKVGDCVRDMGYSQVETVSAVTDALVETSVKVGDRIYLARYSAYDQKKLLKVDCPVGKGGESESQR